MENCSCLEGLSACVKQVRSLFQASSTVSTGVAPEFFQERLSESVGDALISGCPEKATAASPANADKSGDLEKAVAASTADVEESGDIEKAIAVSTGNVGTCADVDKAVPASTADVNHSGDFGKPVVASSADIDQYGDLEKAVAASTADTDRAKMGNSKSSFQVRINAPLRYFCIWVLKKREPKMPKIALDNVLQFLFLSDVGVDRLQHAIRVALGSYGRGEVRLVRNFIRTKSRESRGRMELLWEKVPPDRRLVLTSRDCRASCLGSSPHLPLTAVVFG